MEPLATDVVTVNAFDVVTKDVTRVVRHADVAKVGGRRHQRQLQKQSKVLERSR